MTQALLCSQQMQQLTGLAFDGQYYFEQQFFSKAFQL